MGRNNGSGNTASRHLSKHVPNGWDVEADGHALPQAAYAYEDIDAVRSKWAEVRGHEDGTWEASVGEGRGLKETASGLSTAEQAAKAAADLVRKHFRGGGQTERQRSRQYSGRGGRSDSDGMFDNLF